MPGRGMFTSKRDNLGMATSLGPGRTIVKKDDPAPDLDHLSHDTVMLAEPDE